MDRYLPIGTDVVMLKTTDIGGPKSAPIGDSYRSRYPIGNAPIGFLKEEISCRKHPKGTLKVANQLQETLNGPYRNFFFA